MRSWPHVGCCCPECLGLPGATRSHYEQGLACRKGWGLTNQRLRQNVVLWPLPALGQEDSRQD